MIKVDVSMRNDKKYEVIYDSYINDDIGHVIHSDLETERMDIHAN